MVSPLSSKQLSALSNMLEINSAMSDLQTRITTGKKINSVFDGAAQYLQSEAMNKRAATLLNVNSQIDLSVSAVTMAQKAIAKLKTDFTTAVGDLRALKGSNAAAGAVAGTRVDETLSGVIGTASGESASVSSTPATMGVQASALRANKKVFGTLAAATATDNGSLGVAALSGTQVLRFEFIRANAGGNGIAANGVQGIDFAAADVGDGSGNLANLTLGDVVRKLNASATLDTAVGGDFRASIDADGTLRFSTAAGTASFKVRIGSVAAGAAAVGSTSLITTDLGSSFGVTFNTNAGAGYATVIAGTSTGLTAAEADPATPTVAKVAPPAVTALLNAPARRLYDSDATAANNTVQWDSASNAVSGGNYGLTVGNTISVAVTEQGTKSYVAIPAADLNATPADATLSDFVAQFNARALAAGLVTRAVLDPTKGLTFSGPTASTVSFGQGVDATSANASADTGALNQAFGFPGSAQFSLAVADQAADAASISLLGAGAGLFQAGDIFSITVTSDDASRPDTRTISFKATAASPVSYSGFDGTAAKPYEFSTMADLKKAINTAFNTTQVVADAVRVPGSGRDAVASQFQFQLSLKAGYSMEIAQTNNVGDGTASNAGFSGGLPLLKNAANALDTLFGTAHGAGAGQLASAISPSSVLATQENRNLAGTLVSRQENYGGKITYTRNAALPATAGDPKRASTSQSLARTLSLVANTVEDAALAGQPNILKGATLSTRLSDGDGRIDIALDQPVTTDGLGFGKTGSSFTVLSSSLGDDASVDAAIAAFESAIGKLEAYQASIASSAAALTSSKTMNDGLRKVLSDAATAMTSSDATEDAAAMQALSTRFQLATSGLGLLNQSTQLAAQLLR
jgi:hypothetical protein